MIERYTLPQMGAIWSEENKFTKWLEIELLAAEAQVKLGLVPLKAYQTIKKRASFSLDRIKELERKTGHDLVAFLNNLQENIGPDSKYLHYGMTSYDVEDTALSLRMKESAKIITEDLIQLGKVVREKALKYKRTPCIARTHGVHAEPTSFGLKLALWYAENQRNISRLQRATETVSVGRLSGAVGNYAHLDPEVETYVCTKLGLEPAPVSTQVLQRDRQAEFLTTLAILAGTAEKIGLEIRNLQRTEIQEVEEPFSKGQKGSSAMPHKRNPVSCERICGLARLVRANALAALENMTLWHERDITHSSVERVIIPDSCILVDYMLVLLADVISRLSIFPENMLANIDRTEGLVFSQRVLSSLISKGMTRPKAYALVQKLATQAWEQKKDFKALVMSDPQVKKHLSKQELRECFDLDFFLRRVDYIFKKVFGK
ncbi:MAG: adenylosuccinate lyase [candidate division Zixibacteria bacterium RBG_16_48_11]|nr:MAG: adenylosuccinate lyase [candidate division Zixibacteria bacterium RBG_16_48_11]